MEQTDNLYHVELGDRGRLVLPAALRELLHLKPGDKLILVAEPSGEVRMVSLRKRIDEYCGMLSGKLGHRSLSDELIHERHLEATKEDTE